MFAECYADCFGACVKHFNAKGDDKKKCYEALCKCAEKMMGFMEGKLPEKGFLHGNESPSLGDFAIFAAISLPNRGLMASGIDLKNYPKCRSIANSIYKMIP